MKLVGFLNQVDWLNEMRNVIFIIFSQQILGSKLLLILNYGHHLKLCIKKKKQNKTKNQPKNTMSGTMNFGSPNLTKLKKNGI